MSCSWASSIPRLRSMRIACIVWAQELITERTWSLTDILPVIVTPRIFKHARTHITRCCCLRAPKHTHTHTHKELCPRRVDTAARGIISCACKKFSHHCYESQSIPCNGFTQTHICLIRHRYSPQIRCRKTTNSFVPYLRLKQSYSKSLNI